ELRRVLGDALARQGGLVVVEPRLVRRTAFRALPELAFLRLRGLHDALHEDAWKIDEFRRDFARLDDLVDLDDRALGRLGEARIEVLVASAELDVAEAIGAITAAEGVVETDRVLEHVLLPVELAVLAAFDEVGADARRRIESGDACAAGAAALD